MVAVISWRSRTLRSQSVEQHRSPLLANGLRQQALAGQVVLLRLVGAEYKFLRRADGDHLKAQLAVLRRARFGRSSEKLDREQLELMIGEFEEGVAESEAHRGQADDKKASPVSTKPRSHKPTGRKPLPAHLPRELSPCPFLERDDAVQAEMEFINNAEV